MSKGSPIPTKFDPPEEKLLHEIRNRTGLGISEIIRRAVRLLGMEIETRKEEWLEFLMQDLGTDWGSDHSQKTYKLAGRSREPIDTSIVMKIGDKAKSMVEGKKKQAARKKHAA